MSLVSFWRKFEFNKVWQLKIVQSNIFNLNKIIIGYFDLLFTLLVSKVKTLSLRINNYKLFVFLMNIFKNFMCELFKANKNFVTEKLYIFSIYFNNTHTFKLMI